MSTVGPRRSDAIRNRRRLIAEAATLFTGGAEGVTLEMIAKAADVGVGTLYRHFPTREELVEAVYKLELDELDKRAGALLAEYTAADGIRLWIDDYLQFVSAKQAIRDALRVGLTPGASAAIVRSRISAVVGKFLAVGALDGSLREDVSADDVALGLVGMVLAAAVTPGLETAKRLLGILISGLLTRPEDVSAASAHFEAQD